MVRRQDYHRKNSPGGYGSYGFKNAPEQMNNREGYQQRNQQRDGSYRQNTSNQLLSRYSMRNRAEETIEDIKADIQRIEKEIELELKEIKSLRLGL